MVALFGIYEPSQLQRFNPNTWAGRRRLIAADLLEEIDRSGDGQLRDAFFERFVDQRGAFKRTYRHRFKDFDTEILKQWRAGGDARRPLRVLDVSVSDGSTTLDLWATFEPAVDGALELTATDLDAHHILLHEPQRGPPWRHRRVLISEDGEIVQVIFPPFVFGHPRHDHVRAFPFNRAMRRFAHAYAREIERRWRQGEGGVTATRLLVAHQDFSRLVEQDDRVRFRRWNILQPWTGGQNDIVRAMNVLNPSYFSLDEQRRVFFHLRAALADRGLLAVGSNQGPQSPVDGAIYRLQGGELVEVIRLGAGNRCADALEFTASAGGR